MRSESQPLDGAENFDAVALWEKYCNRIRVAGKQLLLREEAPRDRLNQAEGVRYLSRLVRAGLEMMLEGGDEDWPRWVIPSHETIKIGADNPDNLYHTACINPRNSYRIRGNRGGAAGIYFSTKQGGYDQPDASLEGSGFLDGNALELDEEGRFSIIVSQVQPPAGNWLPMNEQTVSVIVRQTFNNRSTEQPAQLSIERIGGGDAHKPALDASQLAVRLIRAADYTEYTARLFADWAQTFQHERADAMLLGDQRFYQRAGGDPNILYYYRYWALAEDQALLISLQEPTCQFWNFQLTNYWMESLDYEYHRVHINRENAVFERDGRVTLVVAHRDPGHPNWLTTAGHRLGIALFRIVGIDAEPPAVIDTRVVALSQLPQHGRIDDEGI